MAHQVANDANRYNYLCFCVGFSHGCEPNRMRPIELSLPFIRLARMFSFSVRTSFFWPYSGRRFCRPPLRPVKATSDVLSQLSHTRQRSLTSAAISRARGCVHAIIVKGFSVSPDNKLVVSFGQAHATALKALETLAASIDHTENIAGLRKDLMSLRGNFSELLQEQPLLRWR